MKKLKKCRILVGSRAFGIHDKNSDYDWFINDPKLEHKEHVVKGKNDYFIYNFKNKEELFSWHLNENKDGMNVGHLAHLEVLKYFEIDLANEEDFDKYCKIINKCMPFNTKKYLKPIFNYIKFISLIRSRPRYIPAYVINEMRKEKYGETIQLR